MGRRRCTLPPPRESTETASRFILGAASLASNCLQDLRRLFPLELWRTLFNGRQAFGESPKAGRQNLNQRTLGRDIGRVACAHVQGFDLKAHALGR